jgi:ACS family glucarate transporter-like MFS transporter
MVVVGWRETFYVTAPVALIIAAVWWRYVTDSPEKHSRVNSAELRLIGADRPAEETVPETGVLKRLAVNRNIWLLTVSYLCMNYVFYIFFTWFYIYLVDVREFGLLEGGFFASLPFIAGSLAAAVGGWTCDRLCQSIGPRWGCRLPGIVGMVLVAVFLVLGALAANAVWAVVLLSICFASTQFTEGAYWAGATYIGGKHTSAATGVLNTGGNLGGVISAPLIPILVDQFDWLVALSTGSAFALLSALLWLWVRTDEPLLSVRESTPTP